MKKKIGFMIVSIILIVGMFATISACNLSGISEFRIVNQPSTTFEVDDSWGDNPTKEETLQKIGDVTVYIKDKKTEDFKEGKEITLSLAYNTYGSKILIKSFSLKTVGRFTAKIVISNITQSFDYNVIDPNAINAAGFASGTGMIEDPYTIYNFNQFLNLDYTKNNNPQLFSTKKYFKLKADIDFSNASVVKNKYFYDNDCFIPALHNCILDGDGHKLYNINYIANEGKDMNCIFGLVGESVVSNLDIYFNGSTCFAQVINGFSGENTVILKNINTYGNIVYSGTDYNYAAFVGYTCGELTIESCNNNANMYTNSERISAFVGVPCWGTSSKINIFDSNNNGKITANRQVGAFFCNAYSFKKNSNDNDIITMENSHNNGELVALDGGVVNNYIGAANNYLKDELIYNNLSEQDKLKDNINLDLSYLNIKNCDNPNTTNNKTILSNTNLFEYNSLDNQKTSFKVVSNEIAKIEVRVSYMAGVYSLTTKEMYDAAIDKTKYKIVGQSDSLEYYISDGSGLQNCIETFNVSQKATANYNEFIIDEFKTCATIGKYSIALVEEPNNITVDNNKIALNGYQWALNSNNQYELPLLAKKSNSYYICGNNQKVSITILCYDSTGKLLGGIVNK